ncbi:MAG TPA: SRPBCC family protein [Candidatus Acidoferrales bacterium]|nr:SRPBCC family protein [Candidatus Acidoferrales bacterium]
MKTYHLETQVWLPRPPSEIFAFFSNPRNLQRITPPWLNFEILTPEGVEIHKGTLLDYRLKIRRFPVKWQSKITAWQPPHRFVDEQTRGPYTFWIHEHTFEAQSGGTIVADRVDYVTPGGWIIQKFLIAPDLDRIFRYRQEILPKLFDSNINSLPMPVY